MSMLGGAANLVFFAAMLVLCLFNFIPLKKEFRFRAVSVWLQVLPIPLTIAAYWVIFKRAPTSPLYLYLLVADLLLGLVMGVLTRVYRKDAAVFCRRSRQHLVFWLLSLAVTQGNVKLAGTAAASVGTAFMFFSLVTAASAGTVNRRALAAAGALLWLSSWSFPWRPVPRPTPSRLKETGPTPSYLMAKDAFAKGDMRPSSPATWWYQVPKARAPRPRTTWSYGSRAGETITALWLTRAS